MRTDTRSNAMINVLLSISLIGIPKKLSEVEILKLKKSQKSI